MKKEQAKTAFSLYRTLKLVPGIFASMVGLTAFAFLFIPYICLYPLFEGFIPQSIAFALLVCSRFTCFFFLLLCPVVFFSLLHEISINELEKNTVTIAVACLSFLILLLPISIAEMIIKFRAYEFTMTKSQPIVTSIEKFIKTNGKQPNTLDELVPRYLQSIPTTGMNANQSVIYNKGDDGDLSSWSLYIDIWWDFPYTSINYNPDHDKKSDSTSGEHTNWWIHYAD